MFLFTRFLQYVLQGFYNVFTQLSQGVYNGLCLRGFHKVVPQGVYKAFTSMSQCFYEVFTKLYQGVHNVFCHEVFTVFLQGFRKVFTMFLQGV